MIPLPSVLVETSSTISASSDTLYCLASAGEHCTFLHCSGDILEGVRAGDSLTLLDSTYTGVWAGSRTRLTLVSGDSGITVQGFTSTDHLSLDDFGYTSARQVVQSMRSDGHGGIELLRGGVMLVDLAGVSSLSAGQVSVGRWSAH